MGAMEAASSGQQAGRTSRWKRGRGEATTGRQSDRGNWGASACVGDELDTSCIEQIWRGRAESLAGEDAGTIVRLFFRRSWVFLPRQRIARRNHHRPLPRTEHKGERQIVDWRRRHEAGGDQYLQGYRECGQRQADAAQDLRDA